MRRVKRYKGVGFHNIIGKVMKVVKCGKICRYNVTSKKDYKKGCTQNHCTPINMELKKVFNKPQKSRKKKGEK